MEKDLIYMYAVVYNAHKPQLEAQGMEDDTYLYFIDYNDLSAVVSKVPYEIYNHDTFTEKVDDINWLKEKSIRHSNIIGTVFEKTCSVVPVKFGTIFNSVENAVNLLEANYDSFLKNLQTVCDKEEWGIKVFCNLRQFSTANMNDEKVKMEEELSSVSKGARYFIQKKLEKKIEEQAQDKVYALCDELHKSMMPRCCEGKLNKLLSKDATGVPLDMYLNAVYLVEKSQREALLNHAGELKDNYKAMGIFVEQTGPWPGYNFCTV